MPKQEKFYKEIYHNPIQRTDEFTEPEDFDMKARSANEDTFPPFEDGSWDKMELLLDQHLPQKKLNGDLYFGGLLHLFQLVWVPGIT